jgi:hypothetical protein
LKGYMSEHHACVDCGVNTHPGAPPRELAKFLMHRDGSVPMKLTQQSEVYCVRGLAPYGGCLCVGCLEQRIGRKLKRRDFEPCLDWCVSARRRDHAETLKSHSLIKPLTARKAR